MLAMLSGLLQLPIVRLKTTRAGEAYSTMMMLRRSKVCVGATLDMGRRVATGTSTPSPPVKSSPMLSTATMKCCSAAAEPDVPPPVYGFSPHERQRSAAATPAPICPKRFMVRWYCVSEWRRAPAGMFRRHPDGGAGRRSGD